MNCLFVRFLLSFKSCFYIFCRNPPYSPTQLPPTIVGVPSPPLSAPSPPPPYWMSPEVPIVSVTTPVPPGGPEHSVQQPAVYPPLQASQVTSQAHGLPPGFTEPQATWDARISQQRDPMFSTIDQGSFIGESTPQSTWSYTSRLSPLAPEFVPRSSMSANTPEEFRNESGARSVSPHSVFISAPSHKIKQSKPSSIPPKNTERNDLDYSEWPSLQETFGSNAEANIHRKSSSTDTVPGSPISSKEDYRIHRNDVTITPPSSPSNDQGNS